MFVIACRFRTKKKGISVNGLAICSDPDTPVTFIYSDGKPYLGKDIWSYTLLHEEPWALIQVDKD